MGNSLQEQLLKLGLVDEKKLRQTKQEKHKQAKQAPKKAPPQNEQRAQAQKAQAEKAERDRQLNRERQEAAERKAAAAAIKQMIEASRIKKGDGEVAYNFIDGRKVKRFYVTPAVHRQLTDGQVVVVKIHGQYDIVPPDVAEKIRQRDPACVVTAEPPKETEVDEAYAKYQVPDDLMW